MRARTRDRLFLPIVLPIGLLGLLVAVLFAFSRILLSLDATWATATALVVALTIVVVASVAAARAVIHASSLAAMAVAVAGVAMLGGGVGLVASSPAAGGEGAPPGGGEGPPGGGGAPAPTVAASGLQFDTSTIELPADAPTTIRFENKDAGVQHNIAIYEDDSLRKLLFKGDIVTGPTTVDYQVPGLPPGTYFFHCDVHPTMTGRVDVAAGGGPGGGGEPGGGGPGGGGEDGRATVEPSSVVASGLAFDTSTLTIPAGTPTTLQFENKDAGTPHDIAIYPSEADLSTPLFRGEIVTGPATTTYHIPPLQPGSYYFHCDVHPTMNGSVKVE
jgi:plastocyanin